MWINDCQASRPATEAAGRSRSVIEPTPNRNASAARRYGRSAMASRRPRTRWEPSHGRGHRHTLSRPPPRRRRLDRSLTLPDAPLIAPPQAYPLLCINELEMCYFGVGWTATGTPVGVPESALAAM